MILKTQAISKIVTKITGSLELSSSLMVKPIIDNIFDELYAAETIYKAKRLYSEEIAIAWNLVSFALTKYATVI
jgi:hypothetical protein